MENQGLAITRVNIMRALCMDKWSIQSVEGYWWTKVHPIPSMGVIISPSIWGIPHSFLFLCMVFTVVPFVNAYLRLLFLQLFATRLLRLSLVLSIGLLLVEILGEWPYYGTCTLGGSLCSIRTKKLVPSGIKSMLELPSPFYKTVLVFFCVSYPKNKLGQQMERFSIHSSLE